MTKNIEWIAAVFGKDRIGFLTLTLGDIEAGGKFRNLRDRKEAQRRNSRIITKNQERGLMKDPILNPIHPGEILLEDFLKPLSMSQYRLAKTIHVPARRVNEIVLGRRGISADTALRLARFFDTTPQFWLNLQSHYELDRASLASAASIEKSIQPLRKAA